MDSNLTYLALLRDGSQADGTEVDRDEMVELFLDGTFQLATSAGPEDRDTPEFRDYVRESSALIDEFQHRVQDYVRRTERQARPAFQANEWEQICRRRSAIEFLRELSRGTDYELRTLTLDTRALDDLLLDVGQREGYLDPDRIPAGVPPDHWWWWYPNDPPDDD
jgi:hypothetical protein